jgi:hypothetical protein
MSNFPKQLFLALFLTAGVLGFAANAQQSEETPAAPVPVQIAAARKVFISNGGEQSNYEDVHDNWFAGGPNRAYNQFYAAIKTSGRYEILPAPAEADLILEISFTKRLAGATDSQFKVAILDPKTRILLWTITVYVEPAGMPKNREKNYNSAMTALVDELKNLSSAPPAANTQK